MLSVNDIIQLTKDFVEINSISTTKTPNGEYNENLFAVHLKKVCASYGLPAKLIDTPDGRHTVSVFLKGQTNKTIVLIAHHDTVGVEDMEGLNPFTVDANVDKFKDSNRYFYGRGAGDMKSGIAVGVALLEELSKQDLKTNIIFLSAPDEENESAGILAGIKYLKELKDIKGYEYVGVINLDSGLQDENHPERKVVELAGTIGKLLPCFYVGGKSSHASDPFEGISSTYISSAIIDELDGNPSYSDRNPITEKFAPPPICLKATDIKNEYNTQLPLKSFLYFNYHTYTQTPKEALDAMKSAAGKAMRKALEANKEKYAEYMKKQTLRAKERSWDKITNVLTFEELMHKAEKNSKNLQQEFEKIISENTHLDAREVNVKLIEHATNIANITSPYVVCFFSKPYYPSSFSENEFTRIVAQTVESFAKSENLTIDIINFCEGISDTNYMQIDKNKVNEIHTYVENNPLAKEQGDIDIDALASVSMPIACIGPSAFHPHHREEKVEIAYTFDKYPLLLLAVIHNLQALHATK